MNNEFELYEPPTIEFEIEGLLQIGDHDKLVNRDLPNQHPISAITGLEDKLSLIPTKLSDLTNDVDFITKEMVIQMIQDAIEEYDSLPLYPRD